MPVYYKFDQFRRLAEECENMAAKFDNAEQADAWRRVAQGWLALTNLKDRARDYQQSQKPKISN